MVAILHHSHARAGLILSGLLAVWCGYQTSQAQNAAPATPGRGATRDAVTEQELKKRAAAAASMDDLMSVKAKPVGEVRASMQGSLLTSSLFLFDGEMFTVVPVGSILRLPSALRSRVIAKPEGDFTFWPNFLQRNARWLAAKEVPLKMAKGDASAAQAVLREVSTDNRVVVSVYKGGPISILEPPPVSANSKRAASTDPEPAGENPAQSLRP